MTDYTKTTNFTAKDSLPSGNANKIVKGAEIDDEFDNIATAVATKSNIASPTFTGTVTGPTIVATTAFVPDAADGAALGTTSLEFSDLFLADGSIIYFGADQDTTITHVADTGLLINSTRQLQFGDSDTYIHQSADGVLDLVSDTEIEINATTIDMNGNLDLSGTLTMGSAAISEADIEQIDDLTSGTVTASKAVVVDSNKDIGSFRNITLTGELDAATLDISGNADIDGTLEADAITVDGTALSEYIADTVGAMVSSNTETNITVTYEDGDNTLDFVIGTLNQDTTGTADNITVSANNSTDETVYPIFVDGATGSQGAESDTGLTYNPSSGNLTIGGQLAAATLDISGNVDVDGTLEADAITVDGVTLAETIADTVGAMVSSNTETNITVSYEDADNTLDFVIGTLNQDTTGTADNFTVSANNSTDETVYPVFVDGATGSQGAETDTGLTYNPSTGLLTATGFSGNLTGTLQTAAQTNITSLGTLTALTGGTGDFNWDSNTLVVDSSENRVGIGNASPDVSLDIGSFTDAVHVPVGTTAQRPTGAAGYFRYNSTTGKFEGYTDSWGAIGGGSGTNMDTNIFTGDGSDTTFTLSTAPDDENNLMVFVDGVFQAHNAYSVSGTTLTFSAAPANGRVITVYHSTTTVGGSNNTINTMTGDNSDTTLTLSVAPVHENNVQVYFDGVYQSKSNYSISGTTLTFSTAPPTGVLVEAITNTNTSSTTANQLLDADSDTKIQVEESSDEDTIRMDVAGTEVLTLTNSAMTLKGTTPTLTIGDAGAEDTKIVFDGNAQDYYVGLDDSADDLVIGLGSTVGTTPAIIIDENLNVGIGGTPGVTLDVNGGSTTQMRLTASDSTSASIINFGDQDNVAVGRIIYSHVNDSFSFKTNNVNDRLVIDSSGKLLHGTSTVPTGVLLGNQLVSSSATGSEIIAFRADTVVASGDKCGAFLIGNSDTSGTEDHFVGMWGKVVSTNGTQSLHFAAGRSGYEDDAAQMTLTKDGGLGIATTTVTYSLEVDGTAIIGAQYNKGAVMPFTDNTYDLGHSSYRWDDIYATNSTIQTSDKNLKNKITESDLGLSFIKELKPVSYKWKEGKSDRTHYGLIAQDVETVLSDISKPTADFAGFIKMEPEKEAPKHEKNPVTETTYGLRYNEFIAPLIKAVQEQQTLIETLQAEVKALKGE